ncbi:MAG TPA: ABC transporter substrate-binding protein, partial [Casimicrobiaceae bacterium]|nr:ABC transporter substrate-binding protein [Casimicrobiaceae bacterium]
GDLPAAIGVDIDHPDVQPLIPNALEAGLDALRTRGHYPINHTIVVRDELLQARPDLARDVFDAFAEAKRIYLRNLRSGAIAKPTKVDEVHRRVMQITGDPLPYGIEPNRKVLQELVDSAREQGIITRPATIESLFPPGSERLTG